MDPGPDLTIVLLGHTGTGKSASGNTILGQTAFESKLSFKPVTTEIISKSGKVCGKLIRVIDTPGILQNEETSEEIKTSCQRLLQSSTPCLFLVVVSVTRFSNEQQEAVRKAMDVIGHECLKKSYMLFTSGDALDKSVTNFISEDEGGQLPDIVRTFAGYHVFNNRDRGQDQVRELLIMSGHLQPSDPSEDQVLRIVLLGPSERGITSSGNTMLGSKRFKSDKTETVSECATVEGYKLQVVDTPGFSEKVLTLRKLRDRISESKEKADPGAHAFVIVLRIDKVSDTDVKLFDLLLRLFHGEASKYTVVLVTHGDQLEGQSMGEMIQSNHHVSELVAMCGGRCCVFDNTAKRNRTQVQELLRTVGDMVAPYGERHCPSDVFRMFDEEQTAQSQNSPPTLWGRVWTACCCCCCPHRRSTGASTDELEPLLQGHGPETTS